MATLAQSVITHRFCAEGYGRSAQLSQAQLCHCLRITTGILIHDYGPTAMSQVLVAWQQQVLLMQALTEGEGSKTKGLGWLK